MISAKEIFNDLDKIKKRMFVSLHFVTNKTKLLLIRFVTDMFTEPA